VTAAPHDREPKDRELLRRFARQRDPGAFAVLLNRRGPGGGLGVDGWTGTEGTRRLVRAAAEKGAAGFRGKSLPPEQVERRRQTARELNLGQYLDPAHGQGWSKAELRLLGKVSDAEVADRTVRSVNGVRVKRNRLGIRRACDRRRENH
jgi:hypothetical protein